MSEFSHDAAAGNSGNSAGNSAGAYNSNNSNGAYNGNNAGAYGNSANAGSAYSASGNGGNSGSTSAGGRGADGGAYSNNSNAGGAYQGQGARGGDARGYSGNSKGAGSGYAQGAYSESGAGAYGGDGGAYSGSNAGSYSGNANSANAGAYGGGRDAQGANLGGKGAADKKAGLDRASAFDFFNESISDALLRGEDGGDYSYNAGENNKGKRSDSGYQAQDGYSGSNAGADGDNARVGENGGRNGQGGADSAYQAQDGGADYYSENAGENNKGKRSDSGYQAQDGAGGDAQAGDYVHNLLHKYSIHPNNLHQLQKAFSSVQLGESPLYALQRVGIELAPDDAQALAYDLQNVPTQAQTTQENLKAPDGFVPHAELLQERAKIKEAQARLAEMEKHFLEMQQKQDDLAQSQALDVKNKIDAADDLSEEVLRFIKENPQYSALTLEDSRDGRILRERIENYGDDEAYIFAKAVATDRALAAQERDRESQGTSAFMNSCVREMGSMFEGGLNGDEATSLVTYLQQDAGLDAETVTLLTSPNTIIIDPRSGKQSYLGRRSLELVGLFKEAYAMNKNSDPVRMRAQIQAELEPMITKRILSKIHGQNEFRDLGAAPGHTEGFRQQRFVSEADFAKLPPEEQERLLMGDL